MFKKLPTEVLPLVAAVAGGCGLAVYTMGWTLTNNTDVLVRKSSVENRVSWEMIDPETHKPHFPFMAGKTANDKLENWKKSQHD